MLARSDAMRRPANRCRLITRANIDRTNIDAARGLVGAGFKPALHRPLWCMLLDPSSGPCPRQSPTPVCSARAGLKPAPTNRNDCDAGVQRRNASPLQTVGALSPARTRLITRANIDRTTLTRRAIL